MTFYVLICREETTHSLIVLQGSVGAHKIGVHATAQPST